MTEIFGTPDMCKFKGTKVDISSRNSSFFSYMFLNNVIKKVKETRIKILMKKCGTIKYKSFVFRLFIIIMQNSIQSRQM